MNFQKETINSIKMLGIDMVNKANSGHPGIVLSAAEMMYTLYRNHLRRSVKNPQWWNRDRFVLSAGHGSALLYATLFLSGYDFTIADLKNFRQLNSITPGHPEHDVQRGIEMSTGPLGQGLATAVGMAIAEKYLGATFNKPSYNLFNYQIYCLCGDGDLQEGVAYEAINLAGRYKLDNLVVLYDSNDIQLDGECRDSTSQNKQLFFESCGWDYVKIVENTPERIDAVLERKIDQDKPLLIEIKTIIGADSPLAGKSAAHGAPLGEANTESLRNKLGWNYKPFKFSPQAKKDLQSNQSKWDTECQNWQKMWNNYQNDFPHLAKLLLQTKSRNLTINTEWFSDLLKKEKVATRNASGEILNLLQEKWATVFGGSADLSGSTKARGIKGNFDINNYGLRNINYGVREFGMTCVNNGINLSGFLIGFASTFLVFSDYAKAALRLAALMKCPSLNIYTHDSIWVGEDGPTHEPVEQIAMLRAIPNHNEIRPADVRETIGAYQVALMNNSFPSSLILTRQDLVPTAGSSVEKVKYGFYIVSDYQPNSELPKISLIASGSELHIAQQLASILSKRGNFRVVSAPSTFLFKKQNVQYQEKILMPADVQIVIEASNDCAWHQFLNAPTRFLINVEDFGKSGVGEEVARDYKIDLSAASKKVENYLTKLGF